MSSDIVRYGELADGNGLALEDNDIVAYRDGTELGRAAAPASAELRDLLVNYRVPELLPYLRFCYAAPETTDYVITLDPVSLDGEISGRLTSEDDEQMWVARFGRHPDFQRLDEVPAGADYEPYIDADGRGFEFMLSATMQTHPDPLIPRRIAKALDVFLRNIRTQPERMPSPYRARVTNVFSAADPAWRVNIPRVISLDERAAAELV